MSYCGSCGAQIVWGSIDKGGKMPIDAAPVADGNVVQLPSGLYHVLKKGEETTGLRYRSHFSTCPNAAQHRRKR